MLIIKLRALTTLFLLSISALLFAQDFYFENELSFRLDRKCAENGIIPANLFQETEDLLTSANYLPSISGDDYKLFCDTVSIVDFSFDSISIEDELYDNHVSYYAYFNGLWQEMWDEDSLFAKKSEFYRLKSIVDSCMIANPKAGSANAFIAFSQMQESLFFVPFYRNILLNWAVVAYFEPSVGISVELPKSAVYDLTGALQNVLVIRITSDDEIFIKTEKSEKKCTLVDVKNSVVKHITNEGKDPSFAISSEQAIVSLKNERGTSYSAYVGVYNEIVASYNMVRNDYAQKLYSLPFDKLSDEQQTIVKTKYPQKIAEAEPITTD